MKKTKFVLLLLFVLVGTLCAQNTEPVQPEVMSSERKAEIEALEAKLIELTRLEESFPHKVTGFGKELGTALNGFVEALDGGMQVTTSRVNEFAQTDVGKYAMIAIAWKIFAEDIMSIGSSFFNKTVGFIFLFVFCWLLKQTTETICWGKMIVVKKEGPWFARKVIKERAEAIMKSEEGDEDAKINFYIISYLAMIITFIAAAVGLCN